MIVHRFHTEAELGGDFLGAMAFSDKLENFAFAISEEVSRGTGAWIGHDIAQECGDSGTEIGAAVGHCLEAFFKFDQAGGFFDKTMCASFEHLAHKDRVFMTRKNQHADVFKLFGQAAKEIDAVQSGQLGIKHKQVRLHFHAQIIGALAVATFAHKLVVRIQMKNLDQHFTDCGLIFDNDKSLHVVSFMMFNLEYAKIITIKFLLVQALPKFLSSILPRLGPAFLLALLTGCTVSFTDTDTTKTPPSADVAKLQAWNDAKIITQRAPGRLTAAGSGESMLPIYGDTTMLVINMVPYETLQPGMIVAYRNSRGLEVVHRLIGKQARGWRVAGLNNERADDDLVTPKNFIGVVYATLNYNVDEDDSGPAEK